MQPVTLKYFSEPPICQAGIVVSTGEFWDKLNLVSALRERERKEKDISLSRMEATEGTLETQIFI